MGRKTAQRGASNGARRAILDACQALVLEGGYEQISIRRLSDRCGYTAPTIYHHFGDKRGLIDAVLQESFARLLVRLRRVRATGDPVTEIRELLRAFVRFGVQNPAHYQLLASRPPADSEPVQAVEDAYAILETPLLSLHAAGRLKHPDAEAIMQTFWALAHGIINLATSRPDVEWARDLVDVALDSILFGVVRDGAPLVRESCS